MTQHEGAAGRPYISDEQVDETSRALLGEYCVDPLAAYSTQEYLQRALNGYWSDPNSMLKNYSSIRGGNHIFEHRKAMNDARPTAGDNVPIAIAHNAGLTTFFKIGYGIVENTIGGEHWIDQANSTVIAPASYLAWLQSPRSERSTEMRKYLESQDAGCLAAHFIESDNMTGTILSYALAANIDMPLANGGEAHHMSGSQPDVAEEIMEGALAALYLIREHHIAQLTSDMVPMVKAIIPPELPPDYYIG